MSWWQAVAYWSMPKPRLDTPAEKPKLGSEGAMRWKEGRPAGASPVRSGRILVASRKEPGQPWQKSRGIAEGLGLRWCRKCKIRGSNWGTVTVVVKWGSVFSLASAARQSKVSRQ